MIATTPFEAEILRRCQAGELCARVLLHGDFCGREIDRKHGLGLCTWHSEEEKGLPHHGEVADEDWQASKSICRRCKQRPPARGHYGVCRPCARENQRKIRALEVVNGHIVEL